MECSGASSKSLRVLISIVPSLSDRVIYPCLLALTTALLSLTPHIHQLTCTPQTVTAPIAALVMACLLYTYSVTSIRAAKRNAKLHREADGGQLDMRRESLRRHGVLAQVEGTSGIQLFREAKGESKKETEMMGDKKAKPMGEEQRAEVEAMSAPGARTDVEGRLEEYKGRGNAVRKFKEEKPEKPLLEEKE
jgi:hypothetical protein